MRHKDTRRRLKQKPAHARMIKRNLLTSILLYENVRTTRSRAKAVQPMVDRLISTAKKHDKAVAIRMINKLVTDKNASRKVMEVFIERYKNRPSGLTRIKPVGVRQGDGAQLVEFAMVDFDPDAAKPKVAEPVKATPKAKPAAKKEEKVEKKETDSASAKASADKKKPAAKKAPAKKTSTKKES